MRKQHGGIRVLFIILCHRSTQEEPENIKKHLFLFDKTYNVPEKEENVAEKGKLVNFKLS